MENIETTNNSNQSPFSEAMNGNDTPPFDPAAAEQYQAEAMAKYEAEHPDAVKDPEKARAMAEASNQSIINAQDLRDDAKRAINGEPVQNGDYLTSEIQQHYMDRNEPVPNLKTDENGNVNITRELGSPFNELSKPEIIAQGAKLVIEEQLKWAEEDAKKASERYDRLKELTEEIDNLLKI